MDTLRFENAVITQLQIKTNGKSGKNYAVLTLEMDMTPEMAMELGCHRQLYTDDDLPLNGFVGHQLDKVVEGKLSLAPQVGTAATFPIDFADKFSIYPAKKTEDEGNGAGLLKVSCNVRLFEKLNQVAKHYNDVGATPHIVELIPEQTDLDFEGEPPSDTTDAPPEPVAEEPQKTPARKKAPPKKKAAKKSK